MVNLAFSATNPCHLYPMAQAVAEAGASATFYSGYPAWRLPRPHPTQLRTHSLRTLVTYGALRIPERWRPRSRDLFVWQDRGFDRWVGRILGRHDFVHALPGQALETFRRAKQIGVRTVLNHATGPSRHWVRVMAEEYRRAGLVLERATVYDEGFWRREAEEYALTDFHCAASTVVAAQLVEGGASSERIWVVPYGAEPNLFHPGPRPPKPGFRIVFAGQASLRKDLATLLRALEKVGQPAWECHLYGHVSDEAKPTLAAYAGATPLHAHGPVGRPELAEALREASVLVLPSLEEGFGLVVVQALACGTPCLVSEAVGAKDLLKTPDDGSVFPVKDVEALAAQLQNWSERTVRVTGDFSWRVPARILGELSQRALVGDQTKS